MIPRPSLGHGDGSLLSGNVGCTSVQCESGCDWSVGHCFYHFNSSLALLSACTALSAVGASTLEWLKKPVPLLLKGVQTVNFVPARGVPSASFPATLKAF